MERLAVAFERAERAAAELAPASCPRWDADLQEEIRALDAEILGLQVLDAAWRARRQADPLRARIDTESRLSLGDPGDV
jgi:hypothetical protein